MYTVQILDALKTPLVNKFYAQYSVRGRANKQDQVWVVYKGMYIVAACRIQNKHDFLFLSTVFVAPQHRSKGLATRLLSAAVKHQPLPLYTFAYKSITALYMGLGFNQVLTYTPGLKALFDIYAHRNIVALEYL
ncbi:N-acetyltransferase [Pseudoalteromonas sp. S3776]|uniref:GNAT family N-acetyltransferase n=1 Tax=unclassified Pseudoalteromonas TaxID=194690 RepID=UPI001107D8E0|nr:MULTISPECIES: GNAT family N-acetyltransferase [unclassified Pseudoalteromonas]TMO73732.1 N-acetyltransferase [Pseudoalteromonas sp. S3785]TMO78573.1 N-acetyltransferase [Pseudoalteromonas sp. S3776]